MKKIKLKNNKSKKKLNIKMFKFLFFVLIVFTSIFFTTTSLLKNNNIDKDEYLNYLLNKSYKKKTNNFLVKESVKLFSNLDIENPDTLVDKKIKAVGIKDIVSDKKEKDAKANEDNYDSSIYEKITSFIKGKNSVNNDPIVYLYNTHQLETYSNSGLENSDVMPNVLMTSYLLKENLDKENISTIVEDTNINEFIKISDLDSDAFYYSTRIFLKNIMNKYPSIKYFIDLHRDSVSKDISTCTIDNKNYARILFVLGTTNPNYEKNEKLMKSLDAISDELYPNLSRGIYYRPTPDWPDSYNQDLNSNIILIEVGAKDNTIEEVSNTVDALTKILKKHIKGE